VNLKPLQVLKLIKTPGDHWGKAESIQLCDLRVGQTTTGAAQSENLNTWDAVT